MKHEDELLQRATALALHRQNAVWLRAAAATVMLTGWRSHVRTKRNGFALCILEALAVARGYVPSVWNGIDVPFGLVVAVGEASPVPLDFRQRPTDYVTTYNDLWCPGGGSARAVLLRAAEVEETL